MLEYNEITLRKVIVLDGEPCEVLASHVFRKQMRKPVNQTKLRNLISGKVIEKAFHAMEKAEEAEITERNVKYLYSAKGEVWFCEETDPSKRFTIKEEIIGDQLKWMKTNSIIKAISFDEKVIGVRIPVKVELKVTEAMDAIKGNTVQGGTKEVTLENGTKIMVPMFINEGDVLRINTDTGEYVERADKQK
jgi:elongation factor P